MPRKGSGKHLVSEDEKCSVFSGAAAVEENTKYQRMLFSLLQVVLF